MIACASTPDFTVRFERSHHLLLAITHNESSVTVAWPLESEQSLIMLVEALQQVRKKDAVVAKAGER